MSRQSIVLVVLAGITVCLVAGGVVVLFGPLLSSRPVVSAGAIETAIAETQSVQSPTGSPPTETVSPTITVLPTDSPVPPTDTATVEPTPTPDVRLILGDPEDYILQRADLPDRYVLHAGNSTPHINEEVVGVRGAEDGKAYLEATGRLGGWIIWYERADSTAIAPDWIQSYVVMYSKLDGPRLAMSEEWNPDFFDKVARGELVLVDIDMNLGDDSRAYFKRTRQSSGQYFVEYTIEFAYRNVLVVTYGEGLESDVNHDYLETAARVVLDKLIEAPLGSGQ